MMAPGPTVTSAGSGAKVIEFDMEGGRTVILKRQYAVLCALLAVLAFPAAHGKETRYKDFPLDVRDGDRLVIQGLKGHVKLTPQAPGKPAVLRARKAIADKSAADDLARFDALSFAVRRDTNTVTIEIKGPDSKLAWNQWLKPSAPELNFEIEAPQVPVEVNVREGILTVQNWKQALFIGLVSGAIRTTATEGQMRAQIQRGEIKIEKHRGRVEVDSYGAKLSLQELEGDLDLTNFAGESNLNLVHGNIDVRSQAGAVALGKSSGSFDFILGRGSVVVSGFEGSVRGQTDQGAVAATLEGESDVHIESNQGPVTVKLPANSGASVRLQTDEGSLAAPEAIASGAAAARAKVLSGRLNGTGPKGAVAIKSKSAPLRVRL